MRHLIVMGATGDKCPPEVSEKIQNGLHRWPDYVHYVETRKAAWDLLTGDYPDAILAYAPGVFGDAATGRKQSPKIATTEPPVMITTMGDPAQWHGTDDPRQFVDAARHALDVKLVVAADSETGLDVLGTAMVLDTPLVDL